MHRELVDITTAVDRPNTSMAAAKLHLRGAAGVRTSLLLMLIGLLLIWGNVVSSPASASSPSRQLLLEQDIAALLNRRLDRVVPFVNWTYGWAASYANSYIVGAKVVTALFRQEGSWVDIAAGVIRDRQMLAIRERVTRPEADAADISALIERHVSSRVFSDRIKLLNAACTDGMAGGCEAPDSKAIDAAAKSVLQERQTPDALAREHSEITQLLSVNTSVDVNFLHQLRPLVSRVVILLLRLTELASVVVLITAGLRRIYLPSTPLIRIIVTLGIAWGLDYGVLRVERLINSSALEARVVSQIKEQNRAVAAYVVARVAAAESDFAKRAGASARTLQEWQ